jgi:toxin ParE1/3/4
MPSISALLGLVELLYEDIRRWHINGFDRLIILYRETTAGIEVVRVLHTAPDIAALLRDSSG